MREACLPPCRQPAGGPAALAPVGADFNKDFNNEQAAALLAAGRLIQSKCWPGGRIRIELEPGERYPQAVARVIACLSPHERDRLRELVAWVRGYERAEQ